MADPGRDIVSVARVLIALVFMPTLVVLAWVKAASFDPYTTSFFTKTYIAPTPDMPGELRIAGLVFFGIGALLFAIMAHGLRLGRVVFRDIWMIILMGLLLIAFGGAFFLAADRAATAIAERGSEP